MPSSFRILAEYLSPVIVKQPLKIYPRKPDPENKFRLNTYDARIPIPPVKIGKTSIFGNLNYRLMDFNYDNNSIEDQNRLKEFMK